MALTRLDRLAGDADRRQAYLEGFLRLVEAHGADMPAALGTTWPN
jgi:hypothetical protein